MAKAKKADTAEKTQITLEDLNTLRTDLEKQAADKQVELSQRTYAVNFENSSNITKVLNHLNKDVAWSSKNAALLVSLNDNLKNEKSTTYPISVSIRRFVFSKQFTSIGPNGGILRNERSYDLVANH